MSKENDEEEDTNLSPLWTSIGWILGLIVAFCFFEAMCLEFNYFDEFSVSVMLFFIVLQLTRFKGLIEKKE